MYTPQHSQVGMQTGVQPGQQTQWTNQVRFHDEDLANFVLAELKRSAEEYTTALTEAQNPQIRQTLQTLLHKTLADQARLYDWMRANNLYEAPTPAQAQELHKAIQSKQQSWSKLQSFAQQTHLAHTQTNTNSRGQQFFS
jgi:spore coat protein CotF